MLALERYGSSALIPIALAALPRFWVAERKLLFTGSSYYCLCYLQVNFSEESLRENIGAFVHALLLAKPVGLKKSK